MFLLIARDRARGPPPGTLTDRHRGETTMDGKMNGKRIGTRLCSNP